MTAACCAAVAVSMLDTTIVTVALPDLQQHSALGVQDLQWLVNSYLVVFTALTLAGGVLADRYGHRLLLCLGLVVFAGGSLMTGLGHPAGGLDALRVGRLIQGLGAALSEPATLAILRSVHTESAARSRALGAWAATAGLAIAVGPIAGGLLVAIGGWRAVFLANVPLAAIALLWVLQAVPRTPREPGRRLDPLGVCLSALALVGISYGLLQDQGQGVDRTVALPLGLGLLALIALFAIERGVADPAVPVDLAVGRRTLGANLGALAASFAIFAVFFFVTLALQTVGDVSPAATALAFVPMVILLVGGGLIAGRVAGKFGAGRLLTTGLVIAAAGMFTTNSVVTAHTSPAVVVAPLSLLGAGIGLTLAPAVIIVLGAADPKRAGAAASMVNLFRQVGGLLAVAVLGALAVNRLNSALDVQLARIGIGHSLRGLVFEQITHPGGNGGTGGGYSAYPQIVQAAKESFTSGLHLAFEVTIGLLLAAALVNLLMSGLNARAPAAPLQS